VESIPSHTSNFWTTDCKKINQALSVRDIVICGGHKLLCSDSNKGVQSHLTSNVSLPYKIIVISQIFKKSVSKAIVKNTFCCNLNKDNTLSCRLSLNRHGYKLHITLSQEMLWSYGLGTAWEIHDLKLNLGSYVQCLDTATIFHSRL